MNAIEDGMVCPFFQRNDRRCAQRFNLQQLADVFTQCLGNPGGCEIYLALSIESSRSGQEPRGDADVAA